MFFFSLHVPCKQQLFNHARTFSRTLCKFEKKQKKKSKLSLIRFKFSRALRLGQLSCVLCSRPSLVSTAFVFASFDLFN